MTITEAINEVEMLKPNMYDNEWKIRCLSRLDERIYRDIILTHKRNEGEPEVVFEPYKVEDPTRELLVDEPYAEIYVRWLEAQIDYSNREFDAFNNSNAVFESVFSAFRNDYNRTHMPLGAAKRYW